MRNEKIFCLFIFILMIVLSIGVVSAENTDDAIASTTDEVVLEDSEPTSSGSVSGGVDVVTENPWKTTGELSYDIPDNAKTIKSADVYVNVFSVTKDDKYGINTNTTIITQNGQVSYNESLSYNGEDKTVVYSVNDHVTKSNLDYMIHYDITNLLTDLNGTNLLIKVNTTSMLGKETANNVGNIKLIGLVLTYDDGDDDKIYYWINDNQIWTDSNTTLIFDTTSLTDVSELNLTNIALNSADATYKLNGELLIDPDHKSGSYYQYNRWDANDYFNTTKKTEFIGIGAEGSYGVSHKQALAVLTAKLTSASVSLATERSGKVYSDIAVPIAYPGLSNNITVTVNTNKNASYTVKLFADGIEVNSSEVYIKAGTQKVSLVDNTIRPINSSSKYTNRNGTYDKVNYSAQLILNGEKLADTSVDAVILYNGYFNKALYNQNSFEAFYDGEITGDIIIDIADFVKDDGQSGKYATGLTNRVDNWTVTLKNGSSIVKAFLYVPYTSITGDNINMLNATFNSKSLTPVQFIRDQTNAVGAGGYGVLVYDVSDDIISGNNSFTFTRTLSGGIYPSTLIYLTNTTGSNVVKKVHISNCADVLGAYGNGNRKLKIDSTFNINSSEVKSATVYIFGAGSNDAGRASISINDVVDNDVWTPVVKDTVQYFEKDITSIMKDSNEISLILNKGMFTALQQIMVTTTEKTVPPADSINITNPADSKTSTYSINLPNATGNFTVSVDGKVYETKELVNGSASITVNGLADGNHSVVVAYSGDDNFAEVVKNITVTIKNDSTPVVPTKETPSIVAKKKTFKAKVKVKKYSITLKVGKIPVKSVKVFLKVGKKTIKAKTNSKGKATFKIKNLKKKSKNKATVQFKGDAKYNAVSKKVLIIVKK